MNTMFNNQRVLKIAIIFACLSISKSAFGSFAILKLNASITIEVQKVCRIDNDTNSWRFKNVLEELHPDYVFYVHSGGGKFVYLTLLDLKHKFFRYYSDQYPYPEPYNLIFRLDTSQLIIFNQPSELLNKISLERSRYNKIVHHVAETMLALNSFNKEYINISEKEYEYAIDVLYFKSFLHDYFLNAIIEKILYEDDKDLLLNFLKLLSSNYFYFGDSGEGDFYKGELLFVKPTLIVNLHRISKPIDKKLLEDLFSSQYLIERLISYPDILLKNNEFKKHVTNKTNLKLEFELFFTKYLKEMNPKLDFIW